MKDIGGVNNNYTRKKAYTHQSTCFNVHTTDVSARTSILVTVAKVKWKIRSRNDVFSNCQFLLVRVDQ